MSLADPSPHPGHRGLLRVVPNGEPQHGFPQKRFATKDVVDRVAAAVLLLLCAPVFVLLAGAIRLAGPGPVLDKHRRIGRFGREFDLLRFRSTVPHPASRVEAVLRRYSLDELPQLINVVKGDMSLVGPRPQAPRGAGPYGSGRHPPLLVKPGITGLWQLADRSEPGWDDAPELGLRYAENWSIGLDLQILWCTVRAVLRGPRAD